MSVVIEDFMENKNINDEIDEYLLDYMVLESIKIFVELRGVCVCENRHKKPNSEEIMNFMFGRNPEFSWEYYTREYIQNKIMEVLHAINIKEKKRLIQAKQEAVKNEISCVETRKNLKIAEIERESKLEIDELYRKLADLKAEENAYGY